ncbi:MAG: CARDB domain-containing protein, partial [Victivallaceae bacterium]
MNIHRYKILLLISTLIVLISTASAMPSYNDVLLVINDNSPESVEIGNYFKNARKIPDENVVHVNIADNQLTYYDVYSYAISIADKSKVLNAIKEHLTNNHLSDKINYIVTTRGIHKFAVNDIGTSKYHFTDLFLMYNLSDHDFFVDNKYYYYKTELADKVFSKNKIGYYIVARLDGPGVDNIKKMIDNTGFPAFESYKNNGGKVKYVTFNPFFDTAIKNEFNSRTNIELKTPDLLNGETFKEIAKNTMFMFWNGVDFMYPAKPLGNTFYAGFYMNAQFPWIYCGATFLPGSLITGYRSFFSLYEYRKAGGVLKYEPDANKATNMAQYDGSDMKFRHMTCIALDAENNQLWCGTGEDHQNMWVQYGLSYGNADAMRKSIQMLGGGIAVLNAGNGDIIEHYTLENSPLKSNRVVKIIYDKTYKRIWIAHYKGVQYYDLINNTWNEIAEMSNEHTALYDMYQDQYDVNKIYFSCFYDKNYPHVGSQLTGALNSVFEYDKSSKTLKTYTIDATKTFYFPLLAKTAANILWVTIDKNKNVYKYDLNTNQVLETLDLNNIIPEMITTPQDADTTKPVTIRDPRSMIVTPDNTLLIMVSCDIYYTKDQITGQSSKAIRKNYVIRITDKDGGGINIETVNTSDMNLAMSVIGYYEPRALGIDPRNNDLYMGLSTQPIVENVQSLLKSSDSGKTWIKLASSRDWSNINAMTISQDGILYAARGYHIGNTGQNTLSDLMILGGCAYGSGQTHDEMSYNPSPASSPYITNQGIYYSSESSWTGSASAGRSQTEPMMFMILDGFSTGEARFSIFPRYPRTGGGGHTGHMMVFEPKCAPFAPRVDEVNMSTIYKDGKIEIPLHSPGLSLTMDGFIAETINSTTVKIFDELGQPYTVDSMVYDETARKIIISGNFTSPARYTVILKCGIDGIKNVKGASLINTRPDEFKDEIAYRFGDKDLSKSDLIASELSWSPATPFFNKLLTLTFKITNDGNITASAGDAADQTADIYLDGTKLGSVNYDDLPYGTSAVLTYNIPDAKIIAGEHTVKIVADATGKISESDETEESNSISKSFVAVVPPDLTVSDIVFFPSAPVKNQQLQIEFKLNNNISSDAAASIAAIYFGNNKIGEVNCPPLESRASALISLVVNGNTLVVGTNLLKIIADEKNSVYETSESNNTVAKSVTVTEAPDLLIKDIWTFPQAPVAGKTLQVFCKLNNLGYGPATGDYTVNLYIDDVKVASMSVSNLAAKTGLTLQFNVDAQYITVGNRAFKVIVDSGNVVAESNEDNNSLGKGITVTGTGGGGSSVKADFNGRGASDILWQNQQDGTIGTWTGSNSNTWKLLGSADINDWEIVGVGDFNGNGKSDVLWQNKTNGYTGMWESGATWQGFGATPRTEWEIVGVGDFNGNGKSDILWQNTATGYVGMWESGTTWQGFGVVSRADWEVVGV